MKYLLPLFALPLLTLALAAAPPPPVAPSPTATVPGQDVDRSPFDVALLANGRVLAANRTAGTVSLLDVATGKVLAEASVGAGAFALCSLPGGRGALVSCVDAGTVAQVTVTADRLTVQKTLTVGRGPRGVAVSADGARAWVALSGEDAVAEVDLAQGKVVRRVATPWEPWHVALSTDGKQLAVGCTRARVVVVVDTKTGTVAHTIKTLGRNLRHIAIDPDGKWAYVPMISERGAGVTTQNIDRGWIVGNRLCRVPLGSDGPREAITLDTKGDAVGDVDGLALSPDGKTLVLTAGGTHELLFLRVADLPWVAYGGPGDHLDTALQNNSARFRRVKVGGHPRGLCWTADGRQVVVANSLDNGVQLVDVATGTVTRTVAVGGSAQMSLARRGEAIFQDANRSFGSWYSCDSCHTEGGTNGGSFDTLNDGGLGKPKKTPSLRGVADTAPYTWHGWQKSLAGAAHESLLHTMQGPEPSKDDVAAVTAYLESLHLPPLPQVSALAPAAQRGAKVFADKGCASCHAEPTFTTPQVVMAGLEEPDDVYKGYNPPSLRGVGGHAPYLHDGRARTLEQVLTEFHRPSQLTGKPDCTPEELAALVAYLQTL